MIHRLRTNQEKTYVLATNMDASLGQHSVHGERQMLWVYISSCKRKWFPQPQMKEEHPLKYVLVICRSHGEIIFGIQL